MLLATKTLFGIRQSLRQLRRCLSALIGPPKMLLAGLLLCQVSIAEPVWPETQWVRADPASQGLDPQALKLLDAEIRGVSTGILIP